MKADFLNRFKGRAALVKNTLCASLILGAACVSGIAHADYVAGETPNWQGAPLTSYVQGAPSTSLNSSIVVHGTSLIVNQFSLPSAGVLSIRLADIKWPDALSSLSFLITDLSETWKIQDGGGTLLVDVSGPTQLFAAVFASSQSPSDFGLYNLRADFSPVPLPAAVWLLVSGLAGLGFMRRQSSVHKSSI